jgi:hypothetical protein
MTKTNYVDPLDVLADRANFADVEDEFSIISVRGRKLTDYIRGQKRMFYLWGHISPDRVWADVEIVTFDNPEDHSSAKMYLIKDTELDKAVKTGSVIDLSRRKPMAMGKQVAEILNKYATQ